MYSSGADPKKCSLSETTFAEFEKFLSRYQWAFDHPSHSPRAKEIAHAIKHRGEPGCCTFYREDGYKFIARPLRSWAFEQAIKKGRKVYYASWGRYALLYLDIDLHCAWQTTEEGNRAREFLADLFIRFFGKPVIFWSGSTLGLNGYLKVEIPRGVSYKQANQLFDRLEKALRLYLAHHKNLADFEIKGKVGFLDQSEYTWKQYGKLPIHHPDWSFERLEEFKTTPTVWLQRLKDLCRWIESNIPAEVLEHHEECKKVLGDDPIVEAGYFLVTPSLEKRLVEQHGEGWRWTFSMLIERSGRTWLDLSYLGPAGRILSEGERAEKTEPLPTPMPAIPLVRIPTPPPEEVQTSSSHIKIKVDDSLAAEPDSFKRQRQALLQFVRSLKRVPKLDEALGFIREKNLFSGTWSDNLDRRKARVRSILKNIARTFDAKKCSKKKTASSGHVNVGKYSAWAAKAFPFGIVGGKSRWVNPDGEIVEIKQRIHVSPSFIAVFLAICEYSLVMKSNQDGSLPHDRAEALWQTLLVKDRISVRFCARKWAVCREIMASYGVIQITDRNYGPNKAMKWVVGRFFPGLGLWKGTKAPSQLNPVPLADFLKGRKETRRRQHNTTFLHQQGLITVHLTRSKPSRGPPIAL